MSGSSDRAGAIQTIVGAVHARASDPGPLLLIGGDEDRADNRIILRAFVHLAGGRASQIAVIPAVSLLAGPVGRHYEDIFYTLRAAAVDVLDLASPHYRDQPNPADVIEQSTGIFLTGGSQARLMRLIAGTPVHAALLRARARGAVIAGTGAGAAVLGSRMILTSRRFNRHARVIRIGDGLSLLDGVLVDQHFAERRRAGRLVAAIGDGQRGLGIGIDEDTALLLAGDGRGMVIGRGTVTVMLPSSTDDAEEPGSHRIARCTLFPGQLLNILTLSTDFAPRQ